MFLLYSNILTIKETNFSWNHVQINKYSNSDNHLSFLGFYIFGGFCNRYRIGVNKTLSTTLSLLLLFVNYLIIHYISERLGYTNSVYLKYSSFFISSSSILIFNTIINIPIKLNSNVEKSVTHLASYSFGIYLIQAAILPYVFKIISVKYDTIFTIIYTTSSYIYIFFLIFNDIYY